MTSKKVHILWVDDEIDLLKPHILFLEEKGYRVTTSTNGKDALQIAADTPLDLVFLDENMPGWSGLQTLAHLKSLNPDLPVVMVTRSDEEDIMDAAIGSRISDYLIKPVNPKQVLMTIKKHIDSRRLVTRETIAAYQSSFANLGQKISGARTAEDWEQLYKQLVHWDLELAQSQERNLLEVLAMQHQEANQGFSKFVSANYLSWLTESAKDKPLLSPNVFRTHVFPYLERQEKVFVVIIDNMRYDQWRTIAEPLKELFTIETENLYYSILPTATQFARNAMFAGLMPLSIEKVHPKLWVNEDEDEGKNEHEPDLLRQQLNRLGIKARVHYEKVFNNRGCKKIADNFHNYLSYDAVFVVVNFFDILSHARTDIEMVRELAEDEAAFRSLTFSWFNHSNLMDIFQNLASNGIKVVVTSDHGAIRVTNPVKVVGDKASSTNIRYKHGKSLGYKPSEVFEVKEPEKAQLPRINVSSGYIFARNSDYLVYPSNYNQFVNHFRNTFQHGGISMEEMLVPVVVLNPK